jgi:hypothetical protein
MAQVARVIPRLWKKLLSRNIRGETEGKNKQPLRITGVQAQFRRSTCRTRAHAVTTTSNCSAVASQTGHKVVLRTL